MSEIKIYTRKGDEGQTRVIGGQVDKDDARIEACGAVDESNAFIGQAIVILNESVHRDLRTELAEIQQELFDAGADLAQQSQVHPFKIDAESVTRLERLIDRYDAETSPIRQFILPGGTPGAAALHVARAVVRRAERRVVTLAKLQPINTEVRRYLNRLSDALFVMARVVNAREQVADVLYAPNRARGVTETNQ